MKTIGVLDSSVELLFVVAGSPLEAAAGGSQEAAAGGSQEAAAGGTQLYPPVTKPPVLDFEDVFDKEEEVVLSISGGILPVPITSSKIDRF